MRTYSSEDQKNLTNLVDELLTENWFDRAKARGSQVMGAIKGVKDLAKGIGYGVKSGFDDSGESYNKSKEYIKSSVGNSNNAKIDSYIKTINIKIDDVKNDIMSDLMKLDITIPENNSLLIDRSFEMLSKQLNRALTNLKYNGSGASSPSPTPSPTPTPTPSPTSTPPTRKTPTSTPAKKTAKKTPTPTKKTTNKRPTK